MGPACITEGWVSMVAASSASRRDLAEVRSVGRTDGPDSSAPSSMPAWAWAIAGASSDATTIAQWIDQRPRLTP